MHRILERQIERNLGKRALSSPKWRAFFESISKIYTDFDEDRELLNRSLDLSSKEFLENNRRLEKARTQIKGQAKNLALKVASRTKELRQRIKDLENVREAMANVLEDLNREREALATEKAKDEAVLTSIADGCIVVNKSGKIIFINQIAQEMLGYTSKESIGKQWYEILHREDESGNPISPDKGAIRAALSSTTTTPTITSFYYLRRDRTRFPISRTVSPIALEGEIIGAVNIFRDITFEKEIDKAKSEFVSLASHQLRTPLTTISWYTEMILNGDAGKLISKQKEYFKEIYRSNQRMIGLVNTLLDVSRIELGTFPIEPAPTNIIELTQNEISEQKPQINTKQIAFSFSFNKDISVIFIDPKLLCIIIQNLLSNAIKYTPERGKVELTISLVDKNNILLKILDTGYGIPKQQQNQVFTKLFRADNVQEKDTEGTGLGLYIVKSVVEHAGGKIWFESEENKGSTFYVTLPVEGMRKNTKALT